MKSFYIRDIEVPHGTVLSPMSGVTNSPFRRLIKELNPDCVGLLVSEFISVEGLTRDSERSIAMMNFNEEERPYAVQIFGYDVTRVRDAALMVQDKGVDIVDINCGCPAPKVVKRGGGCELMRQPQHLAKILREVKKAITIPLTLKIRSGWDDSSINAIEIAKIAEAEGVECLAIHSRTRAQLYRGLADWDLVSEVVKAVNIPVAGSGDIVCRASAEERLASGVVGLYLGRGAISNPLVFSEIVNNTSYDLKNKPALQIKILKRFSELLQEEFIDRSCIGRIKQLASQMCKGHSFGKKLCRVNTLQEQLVLLDQFDDEFSSLNEVDLNSLMIKKNNICPRTIL